VYFSSTDIHSARQRSLSFCHQISQSYLDQVEDCLKLSTGFAKKLLSDSSQKLQSIEGQHALSSWAEQAGHLNQQLLSQEIPSLISNIVHASASRAEELWNVAGSQISSAKELSNNYFGRSLKSSPWETLWLINLTQKTVDEGLATADRISETAITTTELIDEEVKIQLTPAPRKSRKVSR
jgi:hypothetical protein